MEQGENRDPDASYTRISGIQAAPRSRDGVRIALEDGREVFVDPAEAGRFSIGDGLPESEVRDLSKRWIRRTAYREALKRLARRAASRKEMAAFLEAKGYGGADLSSVLERLVAEGYLDDRRVAEDWVAARGRSRPRSRLAILQELKNRGIPEPLREEVTRGWDDPAQAWAAVEKRLRAWGHLDRDSIRRRARGLLQRLGFPYFLADAAADRAWEALEKNKREDPSADPP